MVPVLLTPVPDRIVRGRFTAHLPSLLRHLPSSLSHQCPGVFRIIGIELKGFESQYCHFLAGAPQASILKMLKEAPICLTFFMCEKDLIVFPSQNCCEDQLKVVRMVPGTYYIPSESQLFYLVFISQVMLSFYILTLYREAFPMLLNTFAHTLMAA